MGTVTKSDGKRAHQVMRYKDRPCLIMLSRSHALIYAYWEGSRWRNWVEGRIEVGSSRMLEKLEVAFWRILLVYISDEAG